MPQPGGVSSKSVGRSVSKAVSAVVTIVIAITLVLTQRGGNSGTPATPERRDPAPTSAPSASPPPSITKPANTLKPAEHSRAESRTQPAAVLRIASWNIEWLGKPEDRSGLARGVAQSADDIADYIRSSEASIVAVEEVVSRERGFPFRSREIEAALARLRESARQNWEYVLFPGRADGDQLTGVLWNRDAVTALNQADKPWDQTRDRPWALPIPKGRSAQGSSLWNRPPHAMKFSAGAGKTDVVVIVLHMKADYNGDFSAHREEEAATLIRALPEVRSQFKDKDLVLIGDTNCPKGPEAATRDIEASGFYDLNTAARQTHWQGGTMDRAFVPLDQPEFKRHAFDVLSDSYLRKRGLSPKDFKRRYSDHFMIVTAVDVGDDDD